MNNDRAGNTMKQLSQAKRYLAGLTADVVAAYVANNSVTGADLPSVIASVHWALQDLAAPKAPEPEKPQPPISIRRSVTPEFIISLEDGKPYKSLRRHLTTRGLTPESYKAKWGLPADYLMMSAAYAKRRSELARTHGLGQMRRRTAGAEAIVVPEATATAPSNKASPAKGKRTGKRAEASA